MNKKQFLESLEIDLNGLSTKEIKEALSYYEEMIDDSIEDGKTEKQIIKDLGKTKIIAKKIIEENAKKKTTNYKTKYSWTILMIVLSPFTFSFVAIWYSIILVIYCGLLTMFLLGISFGLLAITYIIDCFFNLISNLPWATFELGFSILSSGLVFLFFKLTKTLLVATNHLTTKSSKSIIQFIRGEQNEK